MSAANVTEDILELYARLDDLCAVADRGEVGISDFLSPRELHFSEQYLAHRGVDFLAFGGYESAERKRIYLLPEYMSGVSSINDMEMYGEKVSVSALEVSSAGYRKLTHRDYLGSVLGLGVERAVIGDILVIGDDGDSAVIFCDSTLTDFFCVELLKVANEKVKCRVVDLSEIVIPERRMLSINDTVASPRIDCVVGALCSFSRERAREAVVSGIVELDYETEQRPDRAIKAPCTISVRGMGKFRVQSVEDKTKKGRYRLVAEKYL